MFEIIVHVVLALGGGALDPPDFDQKFRCSGALSVEDRLMNDAVGRVLVAVAPQAQKVDFSLVCQAHEFGMPEQFIGHREVWPLVEWNALDPLVFHCWFSDCLLLVRVVVALVFR